VSTRGWLLFCSLGVIWGIPYLLIRVAVRELTPGTLVFSRCALATLILLPFVARRELREVWSRWLPLVAFAVIEITIPWFLLGHAEQKLTSSLTGLLLAAVPLIGALVAGFTGDDDPLGGRRLFGLLLGLVGVAAMVGLDVHGGDAWAVAAVGGTAVGYAVGPIILSRYLSDLPRFAVIATSLAISALIYLPVAVVQRPASFPSAKVVACVLVLAGVCTVLGFIVFFALIADIGPARATVITYVNPAVAALLGVTILGEPFTAGMGIGFALILAGSVLATHRAPPGEPAAVGTTAVAAAESSG
jgi:drug/metabolite transporter (DMT)-like permease